MSEIPGNNSNPAPVSAVNAHSAALLANMKNSSNERIDARVFRSNIVTMRYVFKNGKVAPFLTKNGRDSEYATDIRHEIEELDAEIALRHPNISSKIEEKVATIEPLEALKKKHFEEFMALQAAASKKSNDAGYSVEDKLNVANSTSIAEAASGSTGVVGEVAPAAVKITIGKK